MGNLDVRDCTPSKTPLVKSYYKGESSTPISTLTLREVLVEAAANKPDHVAFKIPEYKDSITIQTLLDKSEQFSKALLYQGISKGDVILMVGVHTCEFYAMFYGAVGIGAPFISPILFSPKERAVVDIMEVTKPKLLVLGHELDFLLQPIEEYISRSKEQLQVVKYGQEDDHNREKRLSYNDFLQSGSSISDLQLLNAQNQITCMDTTFLQTTSGTTGKFKIASMNHRLLVNLALFGHARRDPRKEMKIFGISNVQVDDLMPLLDGVTILFNWRIELQGIVFPSKIVQDPNILLQFIQDERIEVLHAYPYLLAPLINKPIVDQYDLSSWKSGLLVAQAVERKSREWFYERMPNYLVAYGGTEFLLASCTSPEHTNREKFLTTIGYPYPHIELKLVDDQDQIVDIDAVGEVCVRGWSMMNGFLVNGQLQDPADKDGWVRMGDLARMDSTGHLIYIGRKADSIRFKINADCVYPGEIEKVARELPAVNDAVVVGISTEAKGDVICLCVTKSDNLELNLEELKQYCKDKLYSRDLPALYFVFESFPTVGSRRKVSRNAVKEEVLRRLQDEERS